MATRVTPQDTFASLGRHILLDALDLVVDLKRSKGSYIVDARTGKRYLDFFTFVASVPIGLNHPRMTTSDFLEKLAYVAVNKPTNSDAYTAEYAEFVDTFSRIAIPRYLPHAFFVEGGSPAVENALKAAFDWKIRKNFKKGYQNERGTQVIHFERSFHGRTGYALSLTNTEPAKTDLFPKFRWPRILNPAITFPLNDENLRNVRSAEQAAVGQMKQTIRENPDDIAAIIIEPIQGEGGDNHFRKEFFVELRQIADENDIMLIYDEVQTGIGLTGKMWAHEWFLPASEDPARQAGSAPKEDGMQAGARPDMLVFGKKMQVCGFLCSTRIDEVPDNVFKVPSRLNSTWGGNLVDMVRAQRYLEIIQEENLVMNARAMGEYLVKQLDESQREFSGIVGNARGRGLFCSFDLNTNEERQRFRELCFAKGLVLLGSGERSVRFRPPLNVSREEIDEGMRIIRDVLMRMRD